MNIESTVISEIKPVFMSVTSVIRECGFALLVVVLWLLCVSIFVDDFTTLLSQYWPVSIIAFFSAAVANATAVGGGFIFLPLFTFYYGLSDASSLKLALSTQAFGMTSGALSWPLSIIQWRPLLGACVFSGVGMLLGTFYWLPAGGEIHFYFGIVSVVLGLAIISEIALSHTRRKSDSITLEGTTIKRNKYQWLLFLVLCFGGGIINAWVSIGIGEVVALYLIYIWRHNLTEAISTGVATLAFCSLLGFVSHAHLGGIPWDYLTFTSVGVILGGRLGARLGLKLGRLTYKKQPLSGHYLKAFVAGIIFIDGLVVLYNS